MGSLRTMPERIAYDEFSMFHENAQEWGLPYDADPEVRRVELSIGSDRSLSALAWGAQPADLLLVHGGAQNAHTWDTVALALNHPLLAVDLAAHGHSGPNPAGPANAFANGEDLAEVLRRHLATPAVMVGMSLGGLSCIAASGIVPEAIAHLVVVDITPGVNAEKTKAITAFVNGPPGFADFDELLARTIEHNPTRSVSSLRRGVLHNAVQLEDGSWSWRWALHRGEAPTDTARRDVAELWDVIAGSEVPFTLVRAMGKGSVVGDDDVEALRARRPDAQVVEVADAGHSVQGDQPLVLTELIAGLLAS